MRRCPERGPPPGGSKVALWICLNVYNEELKLARCLDSVKQNHPEAKIVAVDGAYQSLIDEVQTEIERLISTGQDAHARLFEKYAIPWSTDRTMEILGQYGVDVIIPTEKPWAHEWVKRSKYFVGQDGDYYFVIDADEELVGKIPYKELTEPSYNLMLHRNDSVGPYPVMRVFKHAPDIRYWKVHHALFRGDKLHRKEHSQTLEDCHLEHDVKFRGELDQIRVRVKGMYYRQLTTKEEGAARKEWRL